MPVKEVAEGGCQCHYHSLLDLGMRRASHCHSYTVTSPVRASCILQVNTILRTAVLRRPSLPVHFPRMSAC